MMNDTANVPRISTGAFGLGTVLLILCLGAAGMLVAQHFGNTLPGCGPQSACAELEATAWGRIPGIGWPVSFLGLSYFVAGLAAWLVLARKVPGWFRRVALAGAVLSLLFIGVMISLSKFCAYCLVVHLANLAFVALVFQRTRRPAPGRSKKKSRRFEMVPADGVRNGFVAGAIAFVVAVVALSAGHAVLEGDLAARAEEDRAQSAERIIEKSREQGDGGEMTQASLQGGVPWGDEGFRGRYVHGPERAPIRIVMLTDYQCPDCYEVEAELEQLMEERDDLAVSIMHFPMATDCNKYAVRTLHANACWAARAAEAAGILGGDEAFFRMHDWLFSRKGSFEDAEVRQAASSIGLDEEAFVQVMQSPETSKRIESDVEMGVALGLHYTPMIFINGVEFKGWQTRGALRRTVVQVAATNPSPAGFMADEPPLAAEKYVNDWEQRPRVAIPPDPTSWSMGAADGTVEVVVFGDYAEENTAKVDVHIREALGDHPDTRYVFRHYPVNQDCNPTLPANVPARSLHPTACLAARGAEAAGALGGEEAYWKMHEYLIQNWDAISEKGMLDHAESIGLDRDALIETMERPATQTAIAEDCRAAQRLGVRSIPLVFVDRRQVPRAVREGENVLARIIARADTTP